MHIWRRGRFLIFVLLIIWATVVYVLLACKFTSRTNNGLHKYQAIELVWWTEMPNEYYKQRRCGTVQCVVSTKKSHGENAAAFLFYGSNLKIFDMPFPRKLNKVWALLHEESPRNAPFVPYNDFLHHFNYTSTFSQYSELPLTTQYLPRPSDLFSSDYFHSFQAKEIEMFNKNMAPILFLQSDCDTMSGREDYVRELMLHMRVDSYGGCLHNLDLPDNLQHDYLNNLYSPPLLSFLGRYKFILSIENGICIDYVTEKFWRPLMIGIIPVYFGAPNIREWQPNNKSVIYIDDFPSPAKLAEFIDSIKSNKTEYSSYLTHKTQPSKGITNKKLQHALLSRKYSVANTELFREFECMVCLRLGRVHTPRNANTTCYNCTMPPVHVPLSNGGKPRNADQWQSIMAVGRCQAQLLNKYWHQNENYPIKEFDGDLNKMVAAGLCE